MIKQGWKTFHGASADQVGLFFTLTSLGVAWVLVPLCASLVESLFDAHAPVELLRGVAKLIVIMGGVIPSLFYTTKGSYAAAPWLVLSGAVLASVLLPDMSLAGEVAQSLSNIRNHIVGTGEPLTFELTIAAFSMAFYYWPLPSLIGFAAILSEILSALSTEAAGHGKDIFAQAAAFFAAMLPLTVLLYTLATGNLKRLRWANILHGAFVTVSTTFFFVAVAASVPHMGIFVVPSLASVSHQAFQVIRNTYGLVGV